MQKLKFKAHSVKSGNKWMHRQTDANNYLTFPANAVCNSMSHTKEVTISFKCSG